LKRGGRKSGPNSRNVRGQTTKRALKKEHPLITAAGMNRTAGTCAGRRDWERLKRLQNKGRRSPSEESSLFKEAGVSFAQLDYSLARQKKRKKKARKKGMKDSSRSRFGERQPALPGSAREEVKKEEGEKETCPSSKEGEDKALDGL